MTPPRDPTARSETAGPARRRRRVYLARAPGVPADFVPTVAANAWRGEADCVVGPFSCRAIAEAYAARAAVNRVGAGMRLRVVAHRDAWYLAPGLDGPVD